MSCYLLPTLLLICKKPSIILLLGNHILLHWEMHVLRKSVGGSWKFSWLIIAGLAFSWKKMKKRCFCIIKFKFRIIIEMYWRVWQPKLEWYAIRKIFNLRTISLKCFSSNKEMILISLWKSQEFCWNLPIIILSLRSVKI